MKDSNLLPLTPTLVFTTGVSLVALQVKDQFSIMVCSKSGVCETISNIMRIVIKTYLTSIKLMYAYSVAN